MNLSIRLRFKALFWHCLLLSIFLSACNRKGDNFDIAEKKVDSTSITIYDVDEYMRIDTAERKEKRIIIIDTNCLNEEKRALKDVKDGLYIYYLKGHSMTTIDEVESVKAKFLKNNIKVEYMYSTCIPLPDGFKSNCYEKYMNIQFEEKYGLKFADSIKQIARQIQHSEASK